MKEYAKVFWERYDEIPNHESVIGTSWKPGGFSKLMFEGPCFSSHVRVRISVSSQLWCWSRVCLTTFLDISAQIEKGEQKIKRRAEIQQALNLKVRLVMNLPLVFFKPRPMSLFKAWRLSCAFRLCFDCQRGFMNGPCWTSSFPHVRSRRYHDMPTRWFSCASNMAPTRARTSPRRRTVSW